MLIALLLHSFPKSVFLVSLPMVALRRYIEQRSCAKTNTEFRRRAQPLPHMALRWGLGPPGSSSGLPDPFQPELAQEFTAATGLPSRGNHCTLQRFGLLGWLKAELYLPMYSLSYEVRVQRLTCFFSSRGLSRTGEDNGFRV